MLDLFRIEAENQTALLTQGLLALEQSPGPAQLESLMRAAHSLKGAARIINFSAAVKVAHAMEDCFVAAQRGEIRLGPAEIDVLLRCVDLFHTLSKKGDEQSSNSQTEKEIESLLDELAALQKARADEEIGEKKITAPQSSTGEIRATTNETEIAPRDTHSVIRLTAENMNRLLGLAGESLVESRRFRPFSDSMQRLKRLQSDLSILLERFRDTVDERAIAERAKAEFGELSGKIAECREFLQRQMDELDTFDRRSNRISQRLYNEILQCRMRPFGDGVSHFPRMVRDLARELGKNVRLEIVGEKTQVDRDILEKLDSALTHLLRNAIDHGCENPEHRQRIGKTPECKLSLEARHAAGMLLVTVSDDGAGIDTTRLRDIIALKNLATPQVAQRLSDEELMEFLFLPGFSLKENVTEISGRGVGLDAVQNMVRSVRGSIRIISHPGKGTRFQLHLPITLSVVRALLVEVAGENYAVPLSQIIHALKIPTEKIEMLEGRQHFTLGNQQVGLVAAGEILGSGQSHINGNTLPVDRNADNHPLVLTIVLGERASRYGLAVDKFLGEREFVVQPLDPRLGKVKDISAAATLEDGSPVLILDVEDVVHSIEKLIASKRRGAQRELSQLGASGNQAMQFGANRAAAAVRKRILVVDDSFTVRELERQLLTERGFEVEVAVDGMDAWNALRGANYDLVLTDVDMPRMSGIELIGLIRKELGSAIPVVIISYKDRPEDKLRGLEAGANIYFTKGSFTDQNLIQTVVNLIGEPDA
jgi:two-component system, chemotaxis family, sensor histidine kinase and response regulator WspE